MLCADDFGLSLGVNAAILDLAAAARLTAISCMAGAAGWALGAPALRGFVAKLDIGLHLTLTDQAPLGSMPRTAPGGRLPTIGRLIGLSLSRRISSTEIAAELDRQVERFTVLLGRPPDFIDGHQHVHVLPGIREVVIARAAAVGATRRPWLRSCYARPNSIWRCGIARGKALAVAGLSLGMREAAGRVGVATNDGFAGVLDYASGPPLAQAMPHFLAGAGRRPLLMCHPGFVDAGLRAADPLVEARQAEFAYLAGPAFAADLATAGCRLARFKVP